MLKKTCVLLLAFVCVITFSGCGIGVRALSEISARASERFQLHQQSDVIVECFNNKDIDTLEEMFCEYRKTNCDLHEQIENAYNCIDGKIVSYNFVNDGMSGGTENGRYTENDYALQLKNIKTDTGKEYIIRYYYSFLNRLHPEEIGLGCILLHCVPENDEETDADNYWTAIVGEETNRQ